MICLNFIYTCCVQMQEKKFKINYELSAVWLINSSHFLLNTTYSAMSTLNCIFKVLNVTYLRIDCHTLFIELFIYFVFWYLLLNSRWGWRGRARTVSPPGPATTPSSWWRRYRIENNREGKYFSIHWYVDPRDALAFYGR